MRPAASPLVWRAVLVGFLAFLALVGFWPSPVDAPVRGNVAGFIFFIHALGVPPWIGYGFLEASVNVALFMPLGALAAMAFPGKPWWRIAAFGLLVSCCMELGQLLFLSSRFPSALDLATNAVGALLGFLLVTLLLRIRMASRAS